MTEEYIAYIKLGVSAFLPVAAAVILYLCNTKTSFGKMKDLFRQIIYGVVFGGLAVVGTEWGIQVQGVVLNCRDSAVLTAGLMFGGPAGIIAGFIGGAERWLAVYWGAGDFTRIACSVSTLLAGLYAAALRKYMFESKRPGWIISLTIGVVFEVFHMTMVFLTNMSDPTAAMAAVKACTVPMVLANGISVMLAAIALSCAEKEKLISGKRGVLRISQTIQQWLLVTVLLAFFTTSLFVFGLQTEIANAQTDRLLELAIEETSDDIRDASDNNLLSLTRKIMKEAEEGDLLAVAEKYDLAEISLVNEEGIIFRSTVSEFVNFDMSSGEQSREFLRLFGDEVEYVQDYGPISYDPSIQRKYAGVRTDYGFIQVGYDAVRFQNDIDSQVVGITKNRHVGNTGYILILDEKYNVISGPSWYTALDLRKEAERSEVKEENVTYRITINGVDSFCRFHTSEGYFIFSVLPSDEALQLRNLAIYVNTFMEILVFALLFVLIYLLVKAVVVNQIKKINESLGRITDGDLEVVVDVRSNVEFASLSDDINSTVATLKHYIDDASARIDKELRFAKDIQASALPNVFPAFPKRKDFDIYALMDPAKEVGGDFYDFYITHEDILNFLVADVSGKGIPAAMFMMRAKTELKSLTESDQPLCDVFTNGNNALCEGNDAGMFVTAWQGRLDLTDGSLQYANAGHNPPLVRRKDGKFEYLRAPAGFVLAGVDGIRYKTLKDVLKPGDTVFLYTDGVTEATNSDKELFGEARLLEAINSRDFEDMKELCTFIKTKVEEFVGEAPQFDDITMVALKYKGEPEVPHIRIDNATIDDIPRVTEFVETELEKIGCPMRTVVKMNIAVDELFSNIVKYGYPDCTGPITVELREKEDPHSLYLKFVDEGIPYNPLTKDDPDITLSAEERKIGGLGIFMVKKSMDDIKYKYENGQNILTISKRLG
ncbi:MAG: SpoIIE family protein phosphatase [Clostridia bacterium]|nr:SpoIIE family protein phosphatase [Clostridia bacterium]